MPLFRRSDGTLIRDLPPLRRVMPYVMKGRNESAVYADLRLDFDRVKKWLFEYNRALPAEPATVLHLALFGLRQLFGKYPQLDRFVAGRRLYQRTRSTVSLIVKESLDEQSPSYAVKLPLAERGESLPEYSRRIMGILQHAQEHQRLMEQRMRRLLRLPGWIVRLAMCGRQWLDDWNLLPHTLVDDDSLYCSCFLANLGSLGLPPAFHHLYEHGTCSLFMVLGSPQKMSVTDWDGTAAHREVLPLRITVDERVADGFECAVALQWLQTCLEDPARVLGPPADAAQGRLLTE